MGCSWQTLEKVRSFLSGPKKGPLVFERTQKRSARFWADPKKVRSFLSGPKKGPLVLSGPQKWGAHNDVHKDVHWRLRRSRTTGTFPTTRSIAQNVLSTKSSSRPSHPIVQVIQSSWSFVSKMKTRGSGPLFEWSVWLLMHQQHIPNREKQVWSSILRFWNKRPVVQVVQSSKSFVLSDDKNEDLRPQSWPVDTWKSRAIEKTNKKIWPVRAGPGRVGPGRVGSRGHTYWVVRYHSRPTLQ